MQRLIDYVDVLLGPTWGDITNFKLFKTLSDAMIDHYPKIDVIYSSKSVNRFQPQDLLPLM